jgi:hypothetical protein
MLKLIIKYIFFPYYTIKNIYIGSDTLWSMFILGYDKAVVDTQFFSIIIWKNCKFGTILVELN